ncbi:bacteriohemerythrin [Herminiimonas fonticola]|uniref:Hemerythrin-like metal-binding protein n=1 Tax=Herminiimonas fonticola TaxID=303380 RepID=A0A4R6G5P8_9BURK|nr:hemerythrin family protein [Herminiimonas fonticola]RBA23752.1 hemerythrin-like metal-binding domain [Herminiimonas fonticola]TDN89753.1 hemerythrin-like metal-binding protein [Herminiimonas fonticola]
MEQIFSQPDISLGIVEMDKAHKVLMREIMSLMQAPNFELARRLPYLVELLETDFRIEEQLMESMDYPELRAHREQHASLLGVMHHTVTKAMNEDYLLPREVLNTLPQWFLWHLVKMDASFVKALKAAGAMPVNHFVFKPKQWSEKHSHHIGHVRS